MDIENLDFKKGDGLIPCIVQDVHDMSVLMLGFMNKEALAQTRSSGRVTFFSRSKNRLWTKGETSGNFLEVRDIQHDCDQDTLLVLVEPSGPVCHTGQQTCFGEGFKNELGFLKKLEGIINDRRDNPKEGSYTTSLMKQGINRIAQKVGEEAVEVVIESKDDNKEGLKNESADLLYHLLILLSNRGLSLSDVCDVLESRHK